MLQSECDPVSYCYKGFSLPRKPSLARGILRQYGPAYFDPIHSPVHNSSPIYAGITCPILVSMVDVTGSNRGNVTECHLT